MRRTDRHLNIFYSYNRDNELIENNMTRAFIVTLRTISSKLRNIILSEIFKPYLRLVRLTDLENLDFALQEKIPLSVHKIRKVPKRYIVTLTGNDIIEDLDKYKNPVEFEKVSFSPYIKPDAWIFDNQKSPYFCFFIECKTVNDVLNAEQIIAYAKYFFGIDDYNEVEKRIIRITWYDIMDVIDELVKYNFIGNSQEEKLLRDFNEFLGYCGVISFKGFPLDEIPDLPVFVFKDFIDLSLLEMPSLPSYEISTSIDFGFGKLPDLPVLKI